MPRPSSFRRIQPALYDAKSAPGERERWPWNPISAAGEVLGRYRRCRGTGGVGVQEVKDVQDVQEVQEVHEV